MIIRQATEADLLAMARLTRGALSFAAPPEPVAPEGADDAAVAARLQPYAAGTTAVALVVEVGRDVMGFVTCRVEAATAPSFARGLITILAIAPAYRGRGIGTRLVRELQALLAARGVREVSVEADSGNDAAVRFWRRAGFRDSRLRMTAALTGARSQEPSTDR